VLIVDVYRSLYEAVLNVYVYRSLYEAVLIVYMQYVDGKDLKQDILMSVNLTTTTRGQDIFAAVDTYLSSHDLPYGNLVACCTDGAASMMGTNKGFNSRLKEKAPLHDTSPSPGQ